MNKGTIKYSLEDYIKNIEKSFDLVVKICPDSNVYKMPYFGVFVDLDKISVSALGSLVRVNSSNYFNTAIDISKACEYLWQCEFPVIYLNSGHEYILSKP